MSLKSADIPFETTIKFSIGPLFTHSLRLKIGGIFRGISEHFTNEPHYMNIPAYVVEPQSASSHLLR